MNRGIDYALRTAVAVVGAAAMINVHEVAHTGVARLAGDPHAWYIFYQSTPSGAFGCLGCNVYDPGRLSWHGNLAVLLAGIMATQLVVFGLLAFRSTWRHRPWAGLLTTLAVVFYSDLPVQMVQGVAADVAQRQELGSGDLANTMFLLSAGHGEWVWLLKLLLVFFGAGMSAVAFKIWRGGRAERPASCPPSKLLSNERCTCWRGMHQVSRLDAVYANWVVGCLRRRPPQVN